MSAPLPLTDGTLQPMKGAGPTLAECHPLLKETGPAQLKLCPYCQRLHPKDDFHRLVKGRGGRSIVYQCDPCYKARQNPEANKERLEVLITNNKLANRRISITPPIPKGRRA